MKRINIKHKFIIGLHVIVEKTTITVYGREPTNKVGNLCNGNGKEYVIVFTKNTPENLERILEMLKNG